MKGQIVRRERRLIFIAVSDRRRRFPAALFLASLDARGRGQFTSFARLMDRAHTSGFDFCGRVTKLQGSKVGLLEFRLTPRRGVSPHLRMFGVIRGDNVLLADGYAKKNRALDRGMVAQCERLIVNWIAANDDEDEEDQYKPRGKRERGGS